MPNSLNNSKCARALCAAYAPQSFFGDCARYARNSGEGVVGTAAPCLWKQVRNRFETGAKQDPNRNKQLPNRFSPHMRCICAGSLRKLCADSERALRTRSARLIRNPLPPLSGAEPYAEYKQTIGRIQAECAQNTSRIYANTN